MTRGFRLEATSCAFAPQEDVLALGTDTRVRVSAASGGKIFSLAPDPDVRVEYIREFFHKMAGFLKRKRGFSPSVVTYDPHPYFAVAQAAPEIAKKFFSRARLEPVFHHVAHAANFGIEFGLRKKFIGVVFDGTGYGADGHVWGGEFFVYDGRSFERAAHFAYQPLAGSEAAIREPWRVAFAILYGVYGRRALTMKFDFLKRISKDAQKLLAQMLDKNFNTALTSSVGRLFDAASALLGICTHAQSEAEAAVALEAEAKRFPADAAPYDYAIRRERGLRIIDPAPLFRQMACDFRHKRPAAEQAMRFHATLAEATARVCVSLKKERGIGTVYCSGGVFMNDVLTALLAQRLTRAGLKACFAKRPFTTDLGISRGQVAAHFMGQLKAVDVDEVAR